jgi:hypothetical protein
MNGPLVSVLLPVFNAGSLAADAVRSILAQTYRHLEVVVVDDGSTDESAGEIERLADPRIRIFRQANAGLAATLNRALLLANGSLIARQDADDVAAPERIARQVEFLGCNPEVGLVGTWARIVPDAGSRPRYHRHPCSSAALKFELLFNNPFVHSSVMLRREVFAAVGGYRPEPEAQPEDYDLWIRVARVWEVANLPEALEVYRETEGSLCRSDASLVGEKVVRLSAANLSWWLRRSPDEPAVAALARVANGQRVDGMDRARALGVVAALGAAAAAVTTADPAGMAELSRRVRARRRQVARALVRHWRLPARAALYAEDVCRRGARAVLRAFT